MENQIRLITTKRGYEHLIKGLQKWIKDEKIIKEIINKNTCEFYGKVAFIKWDDPKHLKIIQTLITMLMGYRNSYRICIKEGNRIHTCSDERCPNEHIKLPMPVMKCEFNDEETIKLLTQNTKNREGK